MIIITIALTSIHDKMGLEHCHHFQLISISCQLFSSNELISQFMVECILAERESENKIKLFYSEQNSLYRFKEITNVTISECVSGCKINRHIREHETGARVYRIGCVPHFTT